MDAEKFKTDIIAQKKKMATVSLCMIVRNEEEVLDRCLSSVQNLVDEIIIVDTGSTDRTKEIAQRYTQKVYDFEWVDDFSKARNFSFNKASKEYILWLDADDIVGESEQEKFLTLKKELVSKEMDSVMMDYHLAFDTKGHPTSSLKRNRLVKRSRNFQWIGAVHEYLSVYGNIVQRDIAITHRKEKPHTDRNLQIYRRKEANGEKFSARDLYYFANELKDNAVFKEAIEKYEQFLATKQGWVEDEIASCIKLADCYGMLRNREQQLQSLLRSFTYGVPRAECYCRLGALFLSEKHYEDAIYWYEQATKLTRKPKQGSLIEHASWTWLPCIQLAVCYDRLGQYSKANAYNDKALKYHPTHPLILKNKAYFEEVLKKSEK